MAPRSVIVVDLPAAAGERTAELVESVGILGAFADDDGPVLALGLTPDGALAQMLARDLDRDVTVHRGTGLVPALAMLGERSPDHALLVTESAGRASAWIGHSTRRALVVPPDPNRGVPHAWSRVPWMVRAALGLDDPFTLEQALAVRLRWVAELEDVHVARTRGAFIEVRAKRYAPIHEVHLRSVRAATTDVEVPVPTQLRVRIDPDGEVTLDEVGTAAADPDAVQEMRSFVESLDRRHQIAGHRDDPSAATHYLEPTERGTVRVVRRRFDERR